MLAKEKEREQSLNILFPIVKTFQMFKINECDSQIGLNPGDCLFVDQAMAVHFLLQAFKLSNLLLFVL